MIDLLNSKSNKEVEENDIELVTVKSKGFLDVTLISLEPSPIKSPVKDINEGSDIEICDTENLAEKERARHALEEEKTQKQQNFEDEEEEKISPKSDSEFQEEEKAESEGLIDLENQVLDINEVNQVVAPTNMKKVTRKEKKQKREKPENPKPKRAKREEPRAKTEEWSWEKLLSKTGELKKSSFDALPIATDVNICQL